MLRPELLYRFVDLVYRRAQLDGHGFPDEDTARRVLTVKIGDAEAGAGGVSRPRKLGPRADDDTTSGLRVQFAAAAQQL